MRDIAQVTATATLTWGNGASYAQAVALRTPGSRTLTLSGLTDNVTTENRSYRATVTVGGHRAPLVWTLTGDAASFRFDEATGTLTLPSPNFEEPEDADGDNVYELTISVTDADLYSASASIVVRVTDVNEPPDDIGKFAGVLLEEGDPTIRRDVSVIFHDPEGDPLTYDAFSSVPSPGERRGLRYGAGACRAGDDRGSGPRRTRRSRRSRRSRRRRRRPGEGGSGAVARRGTNDSGMLWFFDADNWEVLIKVLDGCTLNGHVWVFGASTTNLGYVIRVTDTVTGVVKEYRNEPGVPAPAIADVTAFAGGCER